MQNDVSVTAPRSRMGMVGLIVLLGSLGAMAPMAIDIVLPGLGAIETDLQMLPGTAASAISVFLVGFALGPLLFGPLSDSYGRRPLLLLGLVLFGVSSLMCASATNAQFLLAARLFQGIGAGAAASLPIAIIRDLFDGNIARRSLSYMTMVLGVAPIIAPLIGAAALMFSGWRTIFTCLAILGAILICVTLFSFAESRPKAQRTKASLLEFMAGYGKVLSNSAFTGYALVNAFNFASMFAYVAASSRVFVTTLGVSPTTYGVIFGVTAGGIVGGAMLNDRLLARNVAPSRILIISLLTSLLMTGAVLVVGFLDLASVRILLPLLLVNNMCAGLIRPNVTHEAMHPMQAVAGSASAMLRGLQMFMGACASAAVAALHMISGPVAMGGLMFIGAGVSLLIYIAVVSNKRPGG